MMKEFYYKGHHFKVVPIEGGNDFYIVRDGRNTRKVSKEIAEKAKENVDKLFE